MVILEGLTWFDWLVVLLATVLLNCDRAVWSSAIDWTVVGAGLVLVWLPLDDWLVVLLSPRTVPWSAKSDCAKASGVTAVVPRLKALTFSSVVPACAVVCVDWLVISWVLAWPCPLCNSANDWLAETLTDRDCDWLVVDPATLDCDWLVDALAEVDCDWLVDALAEVDCDWLVETLSEFNCDWLVELLVEVDCDWLTDKLVAMNAVWLTCAVCWLVTLAVLVAAEFVAVNWLPPSVWLLSPDFAMLSAWAARLPEPRDKKLKVIPATSHTLPALYILKCSLIVLFKSWLRFICAPWD